MLRVAGLDVRLGRRAIVSDVSFEVRAGEVFGLVGESGSGKSLTALSLMRLLPPPLGMAGSVRLGTEELTTLPEAEMRARRGAAMGFVFQEPMTALNPVQTIGEQVAEVFRVHGRATRREAADLARATLDRVGLPAPDFPLDRLPHQLSGGQRQRVVIAIAIALRPKLLIADEPTTALDVTTQARILDLLQRLVSEDDSSLLLITHDLAVVADMADRVAVMKDGRIVEAGETVALFEATRHPYTRALLAASKLAPRPRRAPVQGAALLEAKGVVRDYPRRRRSLFSPRTVLRAVDRVSLAVHRGETVGLVGESGSGKSTLGRVLLALDRPTEGTVLLSGQDVFATSRKELTALRRDIQAVFQDPYGSFDPHWRVERVVAEPLHLEGRPSGRLERRRRVEEALLAVGLSPEDADKYPHQFSGGQRQRIAIARALILKPALIVLDEAVSALDVRVRAQVLDLLADLSERFGLAYLFISHDLTVVRAVTDRVLVMRRGEVVEEGPTESVFAAPRHPYTRELIAAAPDLDRALAGRRARNRDEAALHLR